MDVSALTIKIILITIPGGLATLIFEKLTAYQKWSSFKFIVNAIFFGGICYLVSDSVCYFFLKNEIIAFWNHVIDDKGISLSEILRASICSVFIGFIASVIETKKYITRFAQFIGIGSKYGEENLYSYFLNQPHITEVYVRDVEYDKTFHGIIDSFSETQEICELSLRNVKVYEYQTSTYLYDMPIVFISRPKNTIFIEVP